MDQVNLEITTLERWRERFLEAIHQNAYVDARGQRRALEEQTGIDVLGDMMEASILTPNSNYYGEF